MQKQTTKSFGVSLLSPAKHNKIHIHIKSNNRGTFIRSVHFFKNNVQLYVTYNIIIILVQSNPKMRDDIPHFNWFDTKQRSEHKRGTVYSFMVNQYITLYIQQMMIGENNDFCL